MPATTLFDGWTIPTMSISVSLNVNKPGGRIHLQLTDEMGRPAGSRSMQWMKDRDLADLGLCLRDVANAFMWAPQQELLDSLQQSFRKHCPEVPSAGR